MCFSYTGVVARRDLQLNSCLLWALDLARRSDMRPVLDYSKDLRRKLAEGKTLDAALGELRAAGASIFDCIASVLSFRQCDLAEAKQVVESSSAWSDVRAGTEKFYQELSGDEKREV